MGLLDKVKNFFYDEEDAEDFEPVVEKKKESKHRNIEKEERTEVKKREDVHKRYDADDISERDLFKAERTFNFPMDLDDTLYEKTIEINKKSEVKEKTKEEIKVNTYRSVTSYQNKDYRKDTQKEQEEAKKFRPTPIISPIYGVLDKNYKKEDTLIDSTREFNVTKKLDYDTVMRKAYAQTEGINKEEDNKGIFFNLNEEKTDEINNEDDNEVKIIYNDVSFDENMDNTNKESIDNKETSIDEDNILSETKEQDLFNLIDDMYSSDDEDEEDDE